jgi:hypothetical protein
VRFTQEEPSRKVGREPFLEIERDHKAWSSDLLDQVTLGNVTVELNIQTTTRKYKNHKLLVQEKVEAIAAT